MWSGPAERLSFNRSADGGQCRSRRWRWDAGMLVNVCVLFFLVLPWKTQQVFHRCWLLCLCVTRWSLPDRMFIIAVLLRSQWPVTDVFCVPENKTDFLKTDLFKHFFLIYFYFFCPKVPLAFHQSEPPVSFWWISGFLSGFQTADGRRSFRSHAHPGSYLTKCL